MRLKKHTTMKMIQDRLGHSDIRTAAYIYPLPDAQSKQERAAVAMGKKTEMKTRGQIAPSKMT